MKKVLVALLILCSAGMMKASAQSTDKKQFAQRLTDSMTVQLSLTGDQIPKVQAVNETFVTKGAAIKAEGGGKLEKLKKAKAISKERDEALKGILTTDQFKAYEEHKKENREEMKERFKEMKKEQ